MENVRPSYPAMCGVPLGKMGEFQMLCASPVHWVIKEPKLWTYKTVIFEQCASGHILHRQEVVEVEEIESYGV